MTCHQSSVYWVSCVPWTLSGAVTQEVQRWPSCYVCEAIPQKPDVLSAFRNPRKRSFGTHGNNLIALFYSTSLPTWWPDPPRRLKWVGQVCQIIQKAISRNFLQILWEMMCPQSFLVQKVSSLCKSSSFLSLFVGNFWIGSKSYWDGWDILIYDSREVGFQLVFE